MQIRSRIERNFWTELFLSMVPDAFIGIVVAWLTSSGIVGVVLTVIGLQILYFVLWIKSAIWTWLRFWMSGRKNLTSHLHNYLRENRYPEPNDYISDADSYFASVVADQTLPCELRIKAAIEQASLAIPAQLGLFQHAIRINMAYEDAIERYKVAFGPRS